jgi:hypothetical protein
LVFSQPVRRIMLVIWMLYALSSEICRSESLGDVDMSKKACGA